MAARRREPPWRADGEGVTWEVAQPGRLLRFDEDGVHWRCAGAPLDARWSDVLDVSITLPTSTSAAWRAVDLLNWFWPVRQAPRTIEVTLSLKRIDHHLDLGRPRQYPWQLQVVLNDLADVLRKRGDFSPLCRPDVLAEVERLSHRVPGVARLLLNADLFTLERLVGGRGAYRSTLARVVHSTR
jgi:hypothetical protein